jgi:hypothetical protein
MTEPDRLTPPARTRARPIAAAPRLTGSAPRRQVAAPRTIPFRQDERRHRPARGGATQAVAPGAKRCIALAGGHFSTGLDMQADDRHHRHRRTRSAVGRRRRAEVDAQFDVHMVREIRSVPTGGRAALGASSFCVISRLTGVVLGAELLSVWLSCVSPLSCCSVYRVNVEQDANQAQQPRDNPSGNRASSVDPS